ncbi:MAG: hypothetical protein KF833_09010 [Verrucomicrobiae bacterium]|nr:hypothetical protein [Verrucomicrobiae bacterium]
MRDVLVVGLGAVSPAGWGVAALRAAIASGAPLTPDRADSPAHLPTLGVHRVPLPGLRPPWAGHPRMRRAGAITRFAVAAALEALGLDSEGTPGPLPDAARTGLVFCTMTGGVVCSRRFHQEAVQDPRTASPLLFPETVFNAPASHLAAILGLTGRVQTEVGDPTCLIQAFDTALLWIGTNRVDRCLIVAAEEADWLTAHALALRYPGRVSAEGAGALLLAREPDDGALARIGAVAPAAQRPEAALMQALGMATGPADGGTINPRQWDARPRGGRHHPVPGSGDPLANLGEAWAAGAAWRMIEAAASVARGETVRAGAVVPGLYGRAGGVRFDAPESGRQDLRL